MKNTTTTHLPRLISDSGWEKVRLGANDIANIVMGQSPSSSTYNCEGEGLPFFQGKIDFGLRHPSAAKWCSAPLKIAEAGDVLVSVRAPVGDVNIAIQRCCIGRGLAAISAGKKTTSEFLFYRLMHEKPRLDSLGTGAIFKAISKATLNDFQILLPPLPEQRAIAAVLSKIQAAIEVQQRIVATLKELKAATMAKLFREGTRGERLKQTEIGEIPESWESVRLGEISKIGNGSTPNRSNEEYWDGGSIPWITSTKIHETIISKADEFVTEKALRECHLPIVTKGSLLVAITGQGKTLGNAAILDFDSCVNQHLAYLSIHDSSILPEFVLFYLQGQYARLRQASIAGGATKGPLTCGYLERLSIPRPKLGEQKEIANLMMRLITRDKVAEQRERKLTEMFSSMLHLLMTGQVRVNHLNLEAASL